jgi:hypothetical protein
MFKYFQEKGGLIPAYNSKTSFKRVPPEDIEPIVYANIQKKNDMLKGDINANIQKEKLKQMNLGFNNENENHQNMKYFNSRSNMNFLSSKNNLEDIMKSSRFESSLKTGLLEDSSQIIHNDLSNQTHGLSHIFVHDSHKKRLNTIENPKTRRELYQNEIERMKSKQQVILSDSSEQLFKYSLKFDFKVKSSQISQKPLVIEMFKNFEELSGGFMIRISDPQKLEFLFVGVICKEQFYQMKREQNLRLDFGELADKLEEMIQLCLKRKENGEKEVDHRAVLEIFNDSSNLGKGIFRIVQQNEFRESDHISIGLHEAGDKVLVKYLSERLRNEIMCREEREKEIITFSEMVNGLQLENLKYKESLVKVERERTREKEETQTKIQEMLDKERSIKEEIKFTLQKELQEKSEANKRLTEELELTNDTLSKNKKELSNVKETNVKMTNLNEVTISELRQNKEELEKALKQKGSELKSKNQQIIKLELEIAGLSATNKKNEELIKESHELKEEARKNANTHMKMGETQEKTIKELRSQKDKLKGKLIECTQEIGQLARILGKMEEKKNEWQRKKKEIQNSLKEERELGKKVKEILTEKEKQLEIIKNEKLSLEKVVEEKEKMTKELQARLKENEKQLGFNGDTIQYLNNRLEENEKPFLNSTLGNRGLESRAFSKGFGSTNTFSRYRSRDLMYTNSANDLFNDQSESFKRDIPKKRKELGEIKRTNVDAVLAKYAGISGTKFYGTNTINPELSKKYLKGEDKSGKVF